MRKSRLIKILIITFIVLLVGCMNNKQSIQHSGLNIVKWDNFYKGDNIHFYYQDLKAEELVNLEKKYDIDLETNSSELLKSIEISKWINERVKYDRNSVFKGGIINFDKILEKTDKNTKCSDEEIVSIFNQLTLANKIHSRIGILRAESEAELDGKQSYKICEIWSSKYNKWIIIDVINNSYFTDGDVPQSAVEVVEKGLDNLDIIGVKNIDKYKKDLINYLTQYTIKIDNNVFKVKKSNSYICFIKKGGTPQLQTLDGYINSTIFTDKSDLLNISPEKEYIDNKSDKKATIILSKKTIEKDIRGTLGFTLGVFKDSIMIKDYYISLNNSPWEKVGYYYNMYLPEGENSIKLSEDAKEVVREIIFDYNE